ncbi:MAG: stage III sporulation AC/AD family protein [Clostridia bacterium]|nr:stage III sporulation AC/AD family protein [Clostridia bacterium]
MSIITLCGAALIALLATAVIRELRPSLAPFCAAAAGLAFFGYVIKNVAPILEFIKKMDSLAAGGISVMIKALGISVCCQITAEICRDCGENVFASRVELAAKINILLLALPLIKDIVTIAGELAG